MSQVEVDEVLGLCLTLDLLQLDGKHVKRTMRDEASKVPAYNAVPGGALAVVKLYGSQCVFRVEVMVHLASFLMN
jgi:hypothetical protein